MGDEAADFGVTAVSPFGGGGVAECGFEAHFKVSAGDAEATDEWVDADEVERVFGDVREGYTMYDAGKKSPE